MEALQARHERIQAVANVRGIGTGHTFKLLLCDKCTAKNSAFEVAPTTQFANRCRVSGGARKPIIHAGFQMVADERERCGGSPAHGRAGAGAVKSPP